MQATDFAVIGAWKPGVAAPAFSDGELLAAIARCREPAHIVRDPGSGRLGIGLGGQAVPAAPQAWPLLATLPALYPEWLGDRSFQETHRVRFPYIVGEMANGIASAALVIAAARAGLLGFFGAAGLMPERIEQAIDEIQAGLGPDASWGANLIHSPNEPHLEAAAVDLYLRRGVRRVSASAYMALSPEVVRYAFTGLTRASDGRIRRPHHVFAKISRPEVARHFLSPAPPALLQQLVAQGRLTAREAELAANLPVAEDITVEADSGGHTDNRPLTALFPTILALRDELAARYGYTAPVRVGAAGGLGTPAAVAAAFALGAAYVLTGSINQAAVEAGTSPESKQMLAQAGIADVVMAPAADMFELGVKLQVLKRGTMFGARAAKLYEVYTGYPSLEALPQEVQARLEQEVFQRPLADVWADTEAFFAQRDPQQNERAARDPRHKMALAFRWYLGQASRWAIAGVAERRLDYQIWCGPAMGAFNTWVAGSFLEPPQNRTATQIAYNLLEGAAVITRAQQFRTYGIPVPPAAFQFAPRPLAVAS